MDEHQAPLRREDLADDPIEQFAAWFKQAREEVPLAEAMVLATASADGAPAARFLLLKEFGPEGFVFHTDYRSAKAADLDANPRAALAFWWPQLGLQVRITGGVERLDSEASDAYFRTRPRERQLGAWASHQSQPLTDRAELERDLEAVSERFEGQEVERPEHWGGFRVLPEAIEFWQQGTTRLHDRFRYRRDGDGWTIERLSP
jgi:pyridoxamine 5'-phosphate oxidase